MKRKMIGIAAAYIAGLFFASIFSLKVLAVFAGGMLLMLVFYRIKPKDILIMTVCFVAAVGVFTAYEKFRYEKIIALSGTHECFEGEVIGINKYDENCSYILKGRLGGIENVRISYFGNDANAEYGDLLRLEGCELKEYENTYLFSSKDYNKSENIFLRASEAERVSICRRHKKPVKNLLMRYRTRMINDFEETLGKTTGGMLAGMVFGEKQELDPDVKANLRSIGLSHVLAVSGLHVSIIASVFVWIFRRLRLGKYVTFVLLNAVMMLFVVMAESPVSCIRASIMLDLYYAAALFGRQSDTFNSLAIAALLICLCDPYAIYSVGFIMSVSATFGLGVFGSYMTKELKSAKKWQRLIKNFLSIVCVSIFIFPFTLYYFKETTLIAPITNILTLSLCSTAITVGAVYVLLGGLLPILPLADACLWAVIFVSDKFSKLSLSHFSFNVKHSAVILFLLTVTVMLVQIIFGKRQLTALTTAAAFGIIVVYSLADSAMNNKNVRIAVLGSGKSAVVTVLYNGHSDVFDLSGYSRAPEYVEKYLTENGMDAVDNVVLTKNIPGQYMLYSENRKFFDTKTWFLKIKEGEDRFEGTEHFDEDIAFGIDDIAMSYSDNSLNIAVGGTNVRFMYSKPEKRMNAVINYASGSRSFAVDTSKNCGMNNFEITLTPNGSCTIRRL